MKFSCSCAFQTRCGTRHEENEDSLFVYDRCISGSTMPEPVCLEFTVDVAVLLVADGLGAHGGGKTASTFVASQLGRKTPNCRTTESLRETLEQVNRELYEIARASESKTMGCTAAGLVVLNGHMLIFHVGDTRVYELISPLRQLTQDDRVTPESDRVTRSFGGTHEIEPLQPHIQELTIETRKRFLICSDGVTDTLTHEEIAALIGGESPEVIVGRIVDACINRVAKDDISLIIADIAIL